MMSELLVGTRKGLFSFARRRGGYEITDTEFLGAPVTAVLGDRRDHATYAALDHGHFGVKLHRRDAGGDFHEIAAPEYPLRPTDVVDIDPVSREDVPWSLELLWTIEPGRADQPGRLWAGTIPGGLFRSDDRGQSWELVRSLWDDPSRAEWFGGGYDHPGLHSVTVDPRDAASLVVAISSGGIWRSADTGSSWQVATGLRNAYMPPERAYDPYAQDPHRLARCSADPDVIWCQHHNGVFRSTDGARTFTEITERPPSTFGFAVAAHPEDPLTAWFVPGLADEERIPVDGRLVVSRTRDGGESFEVLGTGLPDRHAYHLVYRHGLDVDGTGERLAMASTTGSLFVSDDAGDTWTHVTSGLPPVACVQWTS
jgi:BNR-Asp box repeat